MSSSPSTGTPSRRASSSNRYLPHPETGQRDGGLGLAGDGLAWTGQRDGGLGLVEAYYDDDSPGEVGVVVEMVKAYYDDDSPGEVGVVVEMVEAVRAHLLALLQLLKEK
eukprot:928169-Prorocentrum_minimum.AAC.1